MLVMTAVALVASSASAVAVKTAHVEAELVAAKTALVPGEPITVALRLVLEKGWHTYWRNPGDSGLPTTLAWTLPPGVEAGPIEWPAPQMLPVGPLVNYGYEGVALHLVEIRPQRSLAVGSTTVLAARADWLVCKEVCIPEGADLTLALPVAESAPPDARWGAEIAAARAALPAAARRLECQRDRQRHDDCAQARAAARGRRSRSRTLLPLRNGPDRPLGAAARHARRRCATCWRCRSRRRSRARSTGSPAW